jgi:hypothetical protein
MQPGVPVCTREELRKTSSSHLPRHARKISWINPTHPSHLTEALLAPNRIINHLFHPEFEEPLCVWSGIWSKKKWSLKKAKYITCQSCQSGQLAASAWKACLSIKCISSRVLPADACWPWWHLNSPTSIWGWKGDWGYPGFSQLLPKASKSYLLVLPQFLSFLSLEHIPLTEHTSPILPLVSLTGCSLCLDPNTCWRDE